MSLSHIPSSSETVALGKLRKKRAAIRRSSIRAKCRPRQAVQDFVRIILMATEVKPSGLGFLTYFLRHHQKAVYNLSFPASCAPTFRG